HADLDVLRDVLEQDREGDLLLVVRAERGALLLAHDRYDRDVVELRVVEAVEEVDRAWTRGRNADPERVGAGELRVAARHEGGHLLVAGLDEVGIAVSPVERAEEGVDPVAGVAVDAVDAPLAQALQEIVRDELRHLSSLLGVALPSCGRHAESGNAAPAIGFVTTGNPVPGAVSATRG